MSSIIVRLRCEVGMYRIEINRNKRLTDLKNKIAELLNVPVEKQLLFLQEEPNVPLADNGALLEQCNIIHGSVLHLKGEVKPTRSGGNRLDGDGPAGGGSAKWKNDKGGNHKGGNHNECNAESAKIQKGGSGLDGGGHPSREDRLTPQKEKKEEGKTKNEKEKYEKEKYEKEKYEKEKYEKEKNEKEKNEKEKNEKEKNENQANFKSFDYFLKMREYNTTDLPLNLNYQSVFLTKGRFIKIPLSVTLKHQEYRHVDHLELMNVEEVKNFVQYWYTNGCMSEHRVGWMYGYYREDPHYNLGIRAVCECIYEPPQINEVDKVKLLPDDFLDSVDVIANRLGLERIDPMLSNEPVTNAFMVSDLGMALIRSNLVDSTQTDPSVIQLRNPVRNELLPLILEGGKETNKFDADWFIVRINESAPKVVRSLFKNFHFPRENRLHSPTAYDVKEYFASPKLERGTNGMHRCSDFHLILFACRVLDMETALALCDAALSKKEIDPIMEEILTSVKV
ncbi:nuclear pore associated protein [Plasmodium cynomolgi strain B]|uniref:Nuclear pore associated protein n=1 Tax=Plasmodium cynomolgi (strain B) TaxID=1120755 RepID=K6UUD1_PLACD|nr:nuclear pore associated protein [Plasmodium cynomolgi strain B]GAB66989.1 nuclear pore associated protein [Plasmodium cynomolgi strain B]